MLICISDRAVQQVIDDLKSQKWLHLGVVEVNTIWVMSKFRQW